jgi:site-specific recombinase XerD
MSAVLRLPSAAVPSLEDAFEQFLAECRLRGLAPGTARQYVVTVGPFLRYVRSVGCEHADEVAEMHVRTFLADRQTKVAAKRVNAYRAALRTFFDWACEEGYASANPAARIRKLRETRKIVPTFSEADLRALLAQPDTNTLAGLRDLTLMLLLLDTGVRLSEATGLQLDDLDLPGLTLKVMGKGSKERLVGFSPTFGARLQTYLARRSTALKSVGLGGCQWLFVNYVGGRVANRTLEERFRRYGERAGLAHVRVSPHVFRHTHAVHFVRHGGSPFHLQKALGHSDLSMTRRYCELADTDFLAAQRELSLVARLNLDPARNPRLREPDASADRAPAERSASPAETTSASRPSRRARPARRNGSSSSA